MHLRKRWILTMAALSTLPTLAGPLTISMGGTWGSLSGSDIYFVSGQPWTLSFQIPNPPTVVDSVPAFYVETVYSNPAYTLNGNPVAVPGHRVFFYVNQSLSICLDINCVFQISTFGGSQPLFSGPTSNPTVTPGIYLTDSNGFSANDSNSSLGKALGIQNIVITSQDVLPDDPIVPEPATWLLTGIGALGLALHRRRPKFK